MKYKSFLLGSLLSLTGVFAQDLSTANTFWQVTVLILILGTFGWIFLKD